MKKVLSFTLVLAVSIVLCTTACTQNPEDSNQGKTSTETSGPNEKGGEYIEPVTIRFATAHVSYDNWLAFLEEWNENNDMVNLVIETEANNDMRTKLTTDMAANNMPDIFNYWTKSSLKTFIENDMILDIDEYFAVSDVNSRDEWPADAFKAFNIDGSDVAYGWPEEGSTNILIANKELFEKYDLDYPTTYEELLEVSSVFNKNDIIPLSIGSQHGDAGFWWYTSLFYQYATDEDLMAITSTKDMWKSSSAVKKASDLILDMGANGVFPEDTMANGLWDPIVALYNEEKAAMMVLFPWTCASVSEEIAAKSVAIKVPKMPDALYDPSEFAVGGTNFGGCIYKPSWQDPEKQPAMVEVLDMLLGDESQFLMYQDGGWGSQKIIDEYPDNLTQGIYKVYKEAEEGYQRIPAHLWSILPDVNSREMFMDLMDGLYAKTVTTEDFMNQVGDAVNMDISD